MLKLFLFSLIGLVNFGLTGCGQIPEPKSGLKIIGGQSVLAGDPLARRVAALVDQNGVVKCTVTPISPSKYVTAAHCLYGKSIENWAIRSGLNLQSSKSHTIKKVVIHPEFKPANLHSVHPNEAPNDLAVIESHDVDFGTIPVPIIPKDDESQYETDFVNMTAIVVGYGRTNGQSAESKGKLQKANISILQNDRDAFEFMTRDELGKMACHGDSGGPAFLTRGKQVYLIGIVSRGDTDCSSGETIFTDITRFERFLQAHLN